MNAWGGLRQKASVPTMSLVGISVVALLVASTVTADASPHTNIPVVTTVANAVHAGITGPISSFLNDSAPPKPTAPKKPQPQTTLNSNLQPSSSSTANTNSTTSSSSSSSSTGTSGQSSGPVATVAIASSALSCTPNTGTNSYSMNVASAQVTFQTPPTAGGTITYAWDIVSSNGTVTVGATTGQQQFSAGQTTVTLTPPSQSQYLYTANSNTSSYKFQLHITGPFDITSNLVNVPMSADGSCPPNNNN